MIVRRCAIFHYIYWFRILTLDQFDEWKELFEQYHLLITVPINASLLTVSYEFAVGLNPFPFGLFATRIAIQVDSSYTGGVMVPGLAGLASNHMRPRYWLGALAGFVGWSN